MGEVVEFLKYKSENITKKELETLWSTEPDPVIPRLLKIVLSSSTYGKLAVRIDDEGGARS